MVINANYCAKHNQHMQHANDRGSGGMPPWENLKNRYSEIEFEGISGSQSCMLY